MKTIQDSIQEVARIFGILKQQQQRPDLIFITLEKSKVIPALVHLRDQEAYTHLVMMTAVDYIEDNKFQITYLLHNHQNSSDIGVRTLVDREQAEMQSAHLLWRQVATYQRELHEMFGLNFPGSPRLEEDFALEGWEGPPPMRKDFDTLQYSMQTYNNRPGRKTHDPKRYMKEKLQQDIHQLYPANSTAKEGEKNV
ncbi:MAG: NADH-quinone oxidoreductase subunit C [Candidatus Cloacimonadales bacterium]